ncbi:MAG: rhamnulose-1-phosphate aldolase [Clostridia bacterium]|nr:rhamnulose-1-phosphate aldolase [Clostridia bacterium]
MREFIAGIAEIPEIREEIATVAGYLWDKGWAERNAGNLSYNVTRFYDELPDEFDFEAPVSLSHTFAHLNNQLLLVTATGSRMRDVATDIAANICLLHIIDGGKAYRQLLKPEVIKTIAPTSELPVHLAIHEKLCTENRPEKVIIHTHPNRLIAMTHIREFCSQSVINNILWSMQPETCIFIHEGLGFVPYLQTGSDALAQATLTALEKHRVVLWEKHGCLAIGENAPEAFDLIDIAEKSADIFFTCRNAGFQAEGIPLADLKKLRDSFGIAQPEE